ncbi:MAG: hypothetical protein MI975_07655 [Cytophagales bacterium]|nr:hypothetical protein [Cytophagales bacterium]
MEKFNSTLQEFLEETQHMNFEDNELIRSKSASKNELMSLYGRQNNLRLKGTREFFELRDRAMKNTDDKQWKQIIKKINRITKS